MDKSNFDPTVTKRNAVRQLLSSSETLPRALQRKFLTEQCLAAATLLESREEQTNQFLQVTRVHSYNSSCGTLTFALPPNMGLRDAFSMGAAVSFLVRMLRVVSPCTTQKKSNEKLIRLAEWMFTGPSATDVEDTSCPSMTARGVLIERIVKTNSTITWRMSRRPFAAKERPEETFQPAPSYASEEDRLWSGWTLWDGRYWIRIRVPEGQSFSDFRVRPLLPSDLTEVRPSLGKVKKILSETTTKLPEVTTKLAEIMANLPEVEKNLTEIMRKLPEAKTDLVVAKAKADLTEAKTALIKAQTALREIKVPKDEGGVGGHAKWNDFKNRAPGKIRYTLPVLASGTKAVALPTFDIHFSEMKESKGASSDATAKLQWQVRYKQVGDTLQHLRLPR